MGKITVKPYLNRNVKPKINNENSLLYPLYIRIIYNKFSTSKRSKSQILMTEKGFDYYEKTKTLLANEIELDEILGLIYPLEKELIDIECSIKIIDKWNLDIKRDKIFEIINAFSIDALNYFINEYRKDLEFYFSMGEPNENNYNTDYEKFLLSFNENINESIKTIEQYTKLNLRGFIKENTLVHLKIFELIDKMEKVYKAKYKRDISFAEFVFSDYEQFFKNELKKEPLEVYETIINETKTMINHYIEDEILLQLN